MIVSRPALHVTTELAAWVTRKRGRMRVVGMSMEPTLHDGDYVLVDRGRRPEAGELAVAAPPGEPDLEVVKRVQRITEDQAFWLISDNPEDGVDSRRWGLVPSTRIRGRVTLNLSRPTSSLRPRSTRSLAWWLRR